MKSKNHQDPIQQMADRLREHVVPYREGAWEQFSARGQEKKKRVLFWPYFSAAAVMLLALTLFWPESSPEFRAVELSSVQPSRGETPEGTVSTPESSPKAQADVQGLATEERTDRPSSRRLALQEIEGPLVSIEDATLVENHEKVLASNVNKVEGETIFLPLDDPEKAVAETESVVPDQSGGLRVAAASETRRSTDFLTELLKIEESEKAGVNYRSDKKWSVGLNVSPNMSANNHINIGGGVALAYAVSPKVSISSGVSYLQLDAERGVPRTSMYNSPVSVEAGAVNINVNNKTLDKVQANLVGLDIPLTLNYHINKRIFTSVGVSVFSVLNESGSRQYLNEMAAVSYDFGDARTPEPVVRTFYSKEASPDKMYEGKSVNGFFNFSVGYSIPLSKKVGFSIEPFVKIPMGYISPEELNLSNGGVKISTRF